jgi:O-methyltransferase involved in polyketide biosynthesis
MTAIDGNILEGVSATTLWTLHNRGNEAKRSDGVIRDPWSVTLFNAISYDYRKFGKPNQTHGLRAVAFDAAARVFLTVHPKASVVALAEGRQTSFWRLDRAGVAAELRWYSVDLPRSWRCASGCGSPGRRWTASDCSAASGPASRCWNSVSVHLAEHVIQR